MALPTTTDIKNGDFAFFGCPYFDVQARTDINTLNMDFAFFGCPFTSTPDGGGPPPVTTLDYGIFFGCNF